jgi:lipopolysaccharide export system permease protein
MRIIELYILRRASTMFLAALFWTIAIVWTVQVLGRINLVTDSGQSAAAFAELAAMMLPSIIPVVIPFALLLAAAQTLSAMNADSELVVINASGSSRAAMVRPILLLAVIASMASFFIDNAVDPFARERLRSIVAGARANLLSTVLQEGVFQKVDDGLFIQIGERLPDGRLGGIFVSDSRSEDIDLVYYAKQGTIIEQADVNLLLMADGVVHRKRPSGDVSVIRFSSYALDLSEFASAASDIIMFPKDRSIAYLLNPDPNDKIYNDIPQAFRAELHRRLAEWAYPIVFALIALAVAGDARSHREARIHPMVTALVIALIVRWEGFFVAGKAQTNAAFSPAIYGVPLIAALVCLYFIRSNRTMELPASWADRITSLVETAGDRLSDWSMRLRGFRRAAAERRP